MNYWVMSSNGSRENGVPYWDNTAFGRPQYEVTESLVQALNARTLDYYIYFWDEEPASSLQTRFDGQLAGIKKDDIVFLQFPVHNSNAYTGYLIDYLHNQIGAKCVAIIHDITSWQGKKSVKEAREMLTNHHSNSFVEHYFLSKMDGLIVHNHQMAERLQGDFDFAGLEYSNSFVYLDVFGYSAKKNSMDWKRPLKLEIDFAGNLTKAGFLLGIPSSIAVNVFGREVETDNVLRDLTTNSYPNINYRGNYDHEAIPSILSGSFGLCWASTSYPQITGWSGEYEKYNSPYKAAMYLAADEPIIVAKQSALAEFVEEHGIGLALGDLSKLEVAMRSITKEQYDQMLERTHQIGNLVRQNFPIKRAAFEMISNLEWR